MKKLILLFFVLLLSAFSVAANDYCRDTVMYGMQDEGLDDSQFFRLNLISGIPTDIGALVEDIDIEAMDNHPTTGVIYALTGDYGDDVSKKKLLILDKTTGIPALATGVQLDIAKFSEIGAASFNPNTNELWIGGEGTVSGDNLGIRIVNLGTGVTTLKVNTSKEIESLAWNLAGDRLYSTNEISVGSASELWVYDGSTFEWVCDLDEEIEAMEFDHSGNLVMATHGGTLDTIDPSNCDILNSQVYDLDDYDDIETIAFECEPDNEIPEFGLIGGLIAVAGAIGFLVFRRK